MRRLRHALAATAVLAVSVLGLTGIAHAQEEPATTSEGGKVAIEEVKHEAEANGGTHADAECIELLSEGKSIEDCQAAPNPLLPEKNEIIWGAVGFFVVFFFIWKMGFPAIKQAMDARTERIRNDLESAETAKSEASQVLAEYQAQLADAKAEAGRIIEEARQAADSVRKDLIAKAEADNAELRSKAASDIEAAKAQAIADLRSEVAAIAIGAAEQVVERSLDRDTNVALVESYINQVGAQS